MMRKTTITLFIIVAILLSGCAVTKPVSKTDASTDFFIAVHLDPVMEDGEQSTTLRPERYWDSVVDLIETADDYDQKLTLLMNPQWGLYILDNSDRLELVRSWEKNGHEIGVHYHGPEMRSKWSGFSNRSVYFSDSRFQGTTEDLMNIMTQIPISGVISTCTVNDADANYEFPQKVKYSTDGGLYGVSDLISAPERIILNGTSVLQVNHAKYGEGDSDSVSLNDIKNAIESVSTDEVIGIVFHDKAFGSNPTPYLELFEYLQSINIQTQTIDAILESY